MSKRFKAKQYLIRVLNKAKATMIKDFNFYETYKNENDIKAELKSNYFSSKKMYERVLVMVNKKLKKLKNEWLSNKVNKNRLCARINANKRKC